MRNHLLLEWLGGDLRPIPRQAVWDALALVGLAAVLVANPPFSSAAGKPTMALWVVWMVATLGALVLVSGGRPTHRWTIVFPMVPFVVLQSLRMLVVWGWSSPTTQATAAVATATEENGNTKPAKVAAATQTTRTKSRMSGILLALLGLASGLLWLAAVGLTVLFPAVELPLPGESHLFGVGIADLFVPSVAAAGKPHEPWLDDHAFDPHAYPNHEHFAVRVLYPTHHAESSTIPYLRPHLSDAYCEVNMQQGAPPPLKPFGWFVHYWNLIRLPAAYHAPLLLDEDTAATTAGRKLPLVVYSPGLGGTSETYSYQTLSLAARGFVVVVVEHGDGSLAIMPRPDGTAFRRSDDAVEQDWHSGNTERYKRGRRAMTDYRSREILAATRYMIEANRTNPLALESKGLSFVGRLDADDVHFMGHSFGGASVLHAALQSRSMAAESGREAFLRPRSIVAHDPVTDWMPDATRWSLFDLERLHESETNHTYWTQGQPEPHTSSSSSPLSSIHDFDLFLLFSHQWGKLNWGGIDVLRDMQQRRVFGKTFGGIVGSSSMGRDDPVSLSRVEVLDSAHHIEFSDLCMITPTWLARAVNMTGVQSPLESAKEIHTKTLDFFMEVRGQENVGASR